jgi:proton-translocating NADH-quinone oxidoreductase chain N
MSMLQNLDLSFIDTVFGSTVPIAPIIVIILAAILSPAIYLITKRGRAVGWFALLMIAISGILTGLMMSQSGDFYGEFAGLFAFDSFSGLMMLLFLTVAFIAVLSSLYYSEMTKYKGEYYALMLGATAGMMFVASSSSLLTIFVGVEVVSIASYALVALKKNDPRAAEAGFKYMVIGAISTALTLFGMSMLYGITGTLVISEIGPIINGLGFTLPVVIGLVTIIAGYGFKIAAVPFHMWAPDVYEGAATPVSGFLATGSKKMGFVAMFKIFLVLFILSSTNLAESMQWTFAVIAAVTMTVGNLVAISQSNIKRMLAYSSIAQAGYMLIALAVMSQYAMQGAMFHMFTHVFMKGGAFVVVAALITAGLGERIQDYNGLAKRAPFMAFAMLLFLFSLAGIPPLAGFTSKFVLFSSAIYVDGAVVTQWVWLAFVAILNSAISLYYYARVIKAMYIETGETQEKVKVKGVYTFTVLLCVIAVIVLGLYPGPLLDLIGQATGDFIGSILP